jgi:SAM-dependent methyltransferase
MQRLILWKSDLRHLAGRVLRVLRTGKLPKSRIRSRVPVRKIKKLIRGRGFAVMNGQASWFYTAYQRGDADPLTNLALDFIGENVRKDARILVTGCGTGITLFHLADQGFIDLEGFDFLPECVLVTNEVASLGGYDVEVWQMDGFNPTLTGTYDVITAMHWVFSAWMGNYGNNAVALEAARLPEVRERALNDFLSKYAPHLDPGGFLILELTDAVTDYRLPADHPLGLESVDIYPIRHTPEQVACSAESNGMKIVSKNLCVSYGHHPRTSYILEKL